MKVWFEATTNAAVSIEIAKAVLRWIENERRDGFDFQGEAGAVRIRLLNSLERNVQQAVERAIKESVSPDHQRQVFEVTP